MLKRYGNMRMAERGASLIGMTYHHYGTLNSLLQRRGTFHNVGTQRQQVLVKNPHWSVDLRGFASADLRRKFYESVYTSQQEQNKSNDGSNGRPPFTATPFPFVNSWPRVPLMVLENAPLFPRFMKAVDVRHPHLRNLVRKIVRLNQPYVGLFLKKNNLNVCDTVASLDDVYKIGVFGQIHELYDVGNLMRMIVVSHHRIRIKSQVSLAHDKKVYEQIKGLWHNENSQDGWVVNLGYKVNELHRQCEIELILSNFVPDTKTPLENPVLMVDTVNYYHFPYIQCAQIDTMTQCICNSLLELSSLDPVLEDCVPNILQQQEAITKDAVYICDLAASLSSAKPEVLQRVLEETCIVKRLQLTKELVEKEIELAKLKKDFKSKVEFETTECNRRAILMNQAQEIKKALGIGKTDGETVSKEYRARLKNKKVPEHILRVINEEFEKLRLLDSTGAEFNLVCSYLEWLVSLPWGISSAENLNIEEAAKILESEHYGIEDVKRRILEFIAVSSLKGSTQGRILCFHGPPGIGKTTIAASIARALNRKFFRFSVGGLEDSTELKGHRRAYVGAMPGKPIQCLKVTQTENPVILVDEIDKMGNKLHKDPSSVLLELMDPEQNRGFLDFFLDVPVDFSRVLFICTANAVEAIPEPLLDRMELIEMSGYVAEEKKVICRKYIIPEAVRTCGLKNENVTITDNAVEALIRGYCRESGIRNLRKHIDMIVRKVAFKMANAGGPNYTIDSDNLVAYVGKKIYDYERMYMATPPGVAMGLACTSLGGSLMNVETAKSLMGTASNNASDSVQFTGNLGNVMRESAFIALTLARNFLHEIDPENRFFERELIHLHIPEGSTRKDGPSAGITLVTALLSLALNRSVKPNIAMTGEVSLRGRVLYVGGIKEKTIAAKNSGIQILILPFLNKMEYLDLPNFITKDLTVYFVENYFEVFRICFGNITLSENERNEKKDIMRMRFFRSLTHKIDNSISILNKLMIVCSGEKFYLFVYLLHNF